jgi:para-aminobenzoate synthetase component 1
MELLLSGEWLRRQDQGIFRADIVDIVSFQNLKEALLFPLKKGNYFVIFSYDLTRETMELEIKMSGLPPVIFIEIGELQSLDYEIKNYELIFKGSALSDGEFINCIKRIKGFIADGAIYQVNLTNRFDFNLHGDRISLFLDFYKRQPVPYSFYFDSGEFFIISGSMELFLEKEEKTIRSKPIKGTGASLEELLKSEKDRAENLMITDMMRNDLGRIAEKGSVRVTELFKVTGYETLFQMHSTVEALTERNFLEIIYETFPPASISGAPKRKACEIINLLEPHPRGYYCGCAGLVKEKGDFVLSVLIRTAIGKGDILSYYAGCGIVWDSIPLKELEELYLKIKAFYPFKRRGLFSQALPFL